LYGEWLLIQTATLDLSAVRVFARSIPVRSRLRCPGKLLAVYGNKEWWPWTGLFYFMTLKTNKLLILFDAQNAMTAVYAEPGCATSTGFRRPQTTATLESIDFLYSITL